MFITGMISIGFIPPSVGVRSSEENETPHPIHPTFSVQKSNLNENVET